MYMKFVTLFGNIFLRLNNNLIIIGEMKVSFLFWQHSWKTYTDKGANELWHQVSSFFSILLQSVVDANYIFSLVL